MIDIHSHFLWGMDDGADTMEESLAMLKMAAEAGTTDIVATPHANSRYRFEPDVIRERIAALNADPGPKPRLHTGCDFHLNFENVQDALQNPAKYWVANGPYLMVEFPDSTVAGMGRILVTLLNRGFVPIMTHPERNPHLRRIGSDFLEWIERGCLVQVTAQSLLGRFGKSAEEASWEMVRRRLAHFVASDAHDTQDRPPVLDRAKEAIASRIGSSEADVLTLHNPRSVLLGDSISVEIPKKKPWYRRVMF